MRTWIRVALGVVFAAVGLVSCARAGKSRDAAAFQALADLRASRPGVAGHAAVDAKLRYRPAIEPYVAYLRSGVAQRPVDYVLGLFQAHDTVILCERDHRDISQYDLIYDLVSDERFLAQVGHIFTEIGSRTMSPEVDRLLRAEGLAQEEVTRHLIAIYRDLDWAGYWRSTTSTTSSSGCTS